MTAPLLALLLLAPQDLKQAPEILKDAAAYGIGKTVDHEALAAGLKGSKLLVVAFAASECPISRIYRPRLRRLAGEYGRNGVGFLVVHCNFDDVPGKADGVVHDADGSLAKRLRGTRTTDTFVLDAKGKLRYRGALDDQYGIGYARDEPSRTYLKDALDALLAGKDPAVKATKAPG